MAVLPGACTSICSPLSKTSQLTYCLFIAGSTPFSTPSKSPPSAQPAQLSTATIAGAAVGGVAGHALILVALFLLLRRHKQKKERLAATAVEDPGKPELHSNLIEPPKRYELHETVSNRAELPAPIPELYAYDAPRKMEGNMWYRHEDVVGAAGEPGNNNQGGDPGEAQHWPHNTHG